MLLHSYFAKRQAPLCGGGGGGGGGCGGGGVLASNYIIITKNQVHKQNPNILTQNKQVNK